ncbi:WD40-repeat-containing domain protein [Bombardia bombarda]|uniref:WD40-repeat-containing domain protein n=1 Tax=Bombardia bombarda TaxID=252184 RepID=A0AA40CF65_9PEZI|nr:WD40-repeat-containing domain protein [Bombardia bombarda]
MSSFFTAPSAEKKRKRPSGSEAPKKRLATSKPGQQQQRNSKSASSSSKPPPKLNPTSKKALERDEDISGSDIDTEDENDLPERGSSEEPAEDSADEGETAAEKRLRLAQRYLEKTKQEVDEYGFDAEDIDRDLLAERLQEDVAESKGKVYRRLASELDFSSAAHTQFRWNSDTVTSVAVCPPYAYTTTKDGQLTKWKLQDLPKDQWPQTTRKKPKKPPAPPKRKPERICSSRSDSKKSKDKTYKGHTAGILAVKASQDGKFVATGGLDKRLVIHDAETLTPIRAFTQHRDAVTGLAFRRGTNMLFSCSKDRTVKVWSLNELAYVETLFGHQDEILDVDALAQERCVSVGARDRTARYWKVPEESQLVFRGGDREKRPPANLPIASCAQEGSMDRVAMIDDDMFVTGSDNGTLALWGVHRKKAIHLPRAITALRTIPYSDVVLTGSWDGSVRVWRLSEDKKKLEALGVLGGPDSSSLENGTAVEETMADGATEELKPKSSGGLAKGIVNDIAIFERGDRGKDGICVVIALGKEMRQGRWKVIKDGKCGAMVFEVPKIAKATAATTEGEDAIMDGEGDDQE